MPTRLERFVASTFELELTIREWIATLAHETLARCIGSASHLPSTTPGMTLSRQCIWFLLALAASCSTPSESAPGPVIDVHLHANAINAMNSRAIAEMTGLACATTDEELFEKTLDAMLHSGVVLALVSGDHSLDWQTRAPDRLWAGARRTESLRSIRRRIESGSYRAIAEFAPQYDGLAPDDPSLEPFFALAEELDVPLGIHMGPGPPGAAYRGTPGYRMGLSDPLLLEDVLIRHPKLRLYVMHAGWPMLDEMIGLLHAHPQVYVGLGVIDWALPAAEFHHYLARLVGAGYAGRILFGSDQMEAYGAIEAAIQRIRSADYLSEEQKRAILYDNAARFLRLSEEEIARHHALVAR